jgi:hypothetical protein
MASGNKFNCFPLDLASGVHQMQTGTSHVFKVALTNVAPVGTNTVLANITQVASGGGYTTGGESVAPVTGGQASGVFKFAGVDPAWTASGGGFTFRYAVLYNDSSASDSLIGWWDNGSSIVLVAGDTFSLDLDALNGILTVGG